MKNTIAACVPVFFAVLLGSLGSTEHREVLASFTHTGASFAGTTALYRINPNFVDAASGTSAQQIASLQRGASEWKCAGQVDFEFVYDGTTSVAVVAPGDGVNTVHYSHTDGGGALATTTWVSVAGNTLGFDIRFFDRSGTFDFTWATNPTFNQFDIESVAVHEFGHALGMGHSDVAGSTMFPSVTAGTTGSRTLHADDIAGALALYGQDPTGTPTISSISPPNGWIGGGTRVTITGTELAGGDPVSVMFDGLAGLDVAVVDNTRIAATVPPGTTGGSVAVDVSHAQGTANLDQAYTNITARFNSGLSITTPAQIEVWFPEDAGLTYAGSPACGVSPGIDLSQWIDSNDNRFIPINPDDLYYAHRLGWLTAGVFQNFDGNLDANGRAFLTVNIPGAVDLVGFNVYFATVSLDPLFPSGIKTISTGIGAPIGL